MSNIENLHNISAQVRRDVIRMVCSAKSGHPGGSLSSADILTALFFGVMNHNPKTWRRDASGQDAFILSAGHLAPVYYSVLARSGYFNPKELSNLRQFGALLQGHPSVGIPGVFQASGSLGQGLACAAGIAAGKKMSSDPNRVYCLLGDGELEEGEVWESLMWAAQHKVDNLVAMVDWNNQQIDGTVENVGGLGDLAAKWKAFGWRVIEADGHDFDSILAAFAQAEQGTGRPTVILFHTVMGKGVDFMEGTCAWHGKAPSEEQALQALSQIPETLGDY